jgi:GAF domain-containing protein/ActR/RegA family two-component response regulator
MSEIKISVLLVDDQERQREGLARWLRRQGFTVDAAASGSEALELVERAEGQYDAVLIDQVLPGIDGVETVHRIRARDPNVFVIMMTGKEPEAGLSALQAGAYRYILKPVNNREIETLLHHIGEIRQLEQRLIGREWLLETNRRIAEHVVSAPKGQLLQEIVDAGSRALDVPVCILWELDEADGTLKVAAWSGDVDPAFRTGVQLDSRSPSTRRFLNRREPLALSDVQEAPHYAHKAQAAARGWVSLLSAPMIVQDRVIGMLDVYTRHRRRFAPWEEELLASLAAQAATAILIARRLDRERTRHAALEAVESSAELKAVAGDILDALGGYVAYQRASLQLIRGDDRTLIASRGFDEADLNYWFLRPISQDKLIQRIVQERRPLILSDPSQDPDWGVHDATADIKSWAGVPLVCDDEVIGLVTLDHTQPGFYTDDHYPKLAAFAQQVAAEVRQLRHFDLAQRRMHDLEIVSEVGRIMGTKLEVDDLLETIATQVVERLECAHCTLFFLTEEEGESVLKPEMSRGADTTKIMTRRFQVGEGLAGWVFAHNEPLMLDDAGSDPRYVPPRIDKEEPRSMLVVPIAVGGRTIGVISAEQHLRRWFSQRDLALLEAVAQQTGIAVERARGLQVLQTTAQDIVAAQSPGQILQGIAVGAFELTRATSSVIYLLDEKGRSVVESFEHPPGFKHPPPRMDREAGLTRQIVADGKPRILPDIRTERDVNDALRDRIRSLIALPLQFGERVIGVLYVNDARQREFTETEISFLSTLADLASLAIQSVRQRIDDVEAIRHINAAITSEEAEGGELENVLRPIAERLVERFGAASCAVRLYDAFANRFGERIAAGAKQSDIDFEPRGEGASRQIVRTKEPVYAPDVLATLADGQPVIRPEVQAQGIEAAAYLPLRSEGDVIGLLYLDWNRARVFSEYQQQMLEAFAAQAAVAIRTAQALRDRQAFADRLVRLQQLTALISGGPFELDSVLRRIVDSLGQVFEGSFCDVRLYDASTGLFGTYVATQRTLERGNYPPRKGGVSEYVIETRRPRYIEDADGPMPDEGPRPSPGVVAKGSKALVYLPLIVAGEVIGLLYCNLDAPHRFPPEERRLLELFADQAAIAIDKARLFEEVQAQARQLIQLQQVSTLVLSETLVLTHVLQQVVERLVDVFAAASCAIRLYDAGNDAFVERVAAGPLQLRVKLQPRKRGTSRYAIGERCFLYAETAVASRPDGELIIRPEVVAQGAKSGAYLPLMVGNEIVGMLYLYWDAPRSIPQRERTVLELYAGQAAAAIHNAQLYRTLGERANQLDLLRDIADDMIVYPPHLETTLHKVLKGYERISASASPEIRLRDPATGRYTIRVAQGVLEEQVSYEPRPYGSSQWVIEHRRSFYTEGPDDLLPGTDVPAIRDEIRERGVQASATLPLYFRDEVIGLLYVDWPAPRAFSAEDKRFLELYAGEAAIAIANARFYEEAQRRIRELEALAEIGKIVSSQEVDRILVEIHDQVAKLMDARNLYIAFYDQETQEVSFPLVYDGGERLDPSPDSVWGPRRRGEGRYGLTEYVLDLEHAEYSTGDVWAWAAERNIEMSRAIPTKSWIGAPLLVGGKATGVISIQSHQVEGAYDEDDRRVLDLIAGQTAVAVQNVRLYDERDRRVRELTVLNEIGKAVSTLEVDDILDLVYKQLGQVIDLGDVLFYIALYDHKEHEVRFGLTCEQDEGEVIDTIRWGKRGDEPVVAWQARDIGERFGLTEYVIQKKESVLIREAFGDWLAREMGVQVWPRIGVKQRPTQSWLGVPMVVGDQVTGVISMQSLERERAFDEQDQRLLETVASQAAVAIENADLRADLERRVKERTRQLEALYEASQEVGSTLKTDVVLRSVADRVCALVGADVATIFPYDAAQRSFDAGVRVGAVDERQRAPASQGRASKLVRAGEAIFESAADMTEANQVEIDGRPVRAYAAIPLRVGQEPVGLLFVDYFVDHEFAKDEQQLLQTFGAAAASAINNARRYEMAQRMAEMRRWANLGQLAGSLAHRIGNKGGTIRLRAQQVLKYYGGEDASPEIKEALDTILANNQYLIEMSNLLFKPFRAAEETRAPSNITLHLNSAIRSAQIPPDVTVGTHYGPDLPLVLANRSFVEVFVEIIANAVEAMEGSQKKELTITTSYDDEWVRVSFTDTGKGIAAKDLPRIFELFYRDQEDKRGDQHLGFGLWWVRTFLQDIGGDIEVSSIVGEGSTFVVRLPRLPREEAP